jgi:hypothetical protein
MAAIVADGARLGPESLVRVGCYGFPTMADELRRLTDEERVIRAFVRDGRLTSIPAKPRKRELLLPYLLDLAFPEDRDYEEREVNQRLALLHRDVAALRRYLIDGGLMTRDAGIYRRVAPMVEGAIRPDPWPSVQPPRRPRPTNEGGGTEPPRSR